jgi:hypothetical protein
MGRRKRALWKPSTQFQIIHKYEPYNLTEMVAIQTLTFSTNIESVKYLTFHRYSYLYKKGRQNLQQQNLNWTHLPSKSHPNPFYLRRMARKELALDGVRWRWDSTISIFSCAFYRAACYLSLSPVHKFQCARRMKLLLHDRMSEFNFAKHFLNSKLFKRHCIL